MSVGLTIGDAPVDQSDASPSPQDWLSAAGAITTSRFRVSKRARRNNQEPMSRGISLHGFLGSAIPDDAALSGAQRDPAS
jgi:hypothetical protein